MTCDVQGVDTKKPAPKSLLGVSTIADRIPFRVGRLRSKVNDKYFTYRSRPHQPRALPLSQYTCSSGTEKSFSVIPEKRRSAPEFQRPDVEAVLPQPFVLTLRGHLSIRTDMTPPQQLETRLSSTRVLKACDACKARKVRCSGMASAIFVRRGYCIGYQVTLRRLNQEIRHRVHDVL